MGSNSPPLSRRPFGQTDWHAVSTSTPWTPKGEPAPVGHPSTTVMAVDGQAFYLSDANGDVNQGTPQGLFVGDTRFLDRPCRAAGQPAAARAAGDVTARLLRGHDRAAGAHTAPGQPSPDLLVVRAGGTSTLALLAGDPYYGSADSSPLFVMLLAEACRWGAPLDALVPAADAALGGSSTTATATAMVSSRPAADAGGPGQPGLEGLVGRRALRGRPGGGSAAHSLGGAGLCLLARIGPTRGLGRGWLRRAAGGRRHVGRPSRGRAGGVQRSVLDGGARHVRDGPRRRQGPGRRRDLQRWPLPLDGDRRGGAGGKEVGANLLSRAMWSHLLVLRSLLGLGRWPLSRRLVGAGRTALPEASVAAHLGGIHLAGHRIGVTVAPDAVTVRGLPSSWTIDGAI